MNAHELADALIEAATADAVVRVDVARNLNLRWANSTTTTNGSTSMTNLAVAAIVDGKIGSLSLSVSGDEDPVAIMRAAEEAAATKPPSPDVMSLVEGSGDAPNDWEREPVEAPPERFATLTSELDRMFRSSRAAGDPTYGYAEHDEKTTWLATTAGMRKRAAIGTGSLSFTTKDPSRTRSTWAGEWVADWDAIDPNARYETMRQRLEIATKQIDLPAGRYDVILTPACVADIFVYFMLLANLRNAVDGESPFSKVGGGSRLGERLTDAKVTISSDPSFPGLHGLPFAATTTGSTASASVFDAGMDAARVDFVRDGVLANLTAPRAVAERAGVDPVVAPRNILFAGDGATLDEMIASTDRALLLNALWYIRLVDPRSMLLTGLTRDGVYLVEDGALRGAVNNFRFNVSPIDLLGDITEIGRAEITLPREFETMLASAPPVRATNWNMSSVSEAS